MPWLFYNQRLNKRNPSYGQRLLHELETVFTSVEVLRAAPSSSLDNGLANTIAELSQQSLASKDSIFRLLKDAAAGTTFVIVNTIFRPELDINAC